MKIKNGAYLGISLLLILPLGYFLLDRIEFVTTAQRTSATVEQVTSENTSCGRKRTRHACTKYQATLSYRAQGLQYRISVSAGRSRGHNQPISHADYVVGGREVVVYDPRQPSRAYRNRLWDIWGAPLITFFVQIGAFVASFTERQKSKRY